MGTTQTKLYNGALKILGETKLSSVSEAREPRYALDDVYDDALAFCLEQGQWWFARREVQIAADATAPSFGFAFKFEKPSDWVRTMAISTDSLFSIPISDASDQPDWWYANTDPIYVAYVSNHASFGLDLTRWPPTFTRYVEHELAERICIQITQSEQKYEKVVIMRDKAKLDALNKDAMNDPQLKTKMSGSFVASRLGSGSGAGTYRNGIYYR